ncbi:hypothetical protein [Celeribacter sp.]|uniref:hypothetical protein n=1 Tax=Celeribacter sp. TaxID=1890673 RepID=UPI003A922503
MTRTTLQSLMWPEVGLNTEVDTYMRLLEGAAFSLRDQEILFGEKGQAEFSTYANLFNIGKWKRCCALNDLALTLAGEGTFELVVFNAPCHRSWRLLANEVITLKAGEPLTTMLDISGTVFSTSVIFFKLRALSTDGKLSAARWETEQAPLRTPELCLAITTFKREEAVAKTVSRFNQFFETSPLADHIHLAVIDNGQSTDLASTDNITVIPNENMGGSGGFARGLLEAKSRGASHCLFMDDDASTHMESIERTWMFLAYATDPNTAVAGAITDADVKWRLWENSAVFETVCQPQFCGLDLRDQHSVLAMEYDTIPRCASNAYGGWWYFAFPVESVEHMPFPFFVRGDDVSFSLVHDFDIVTLNGVVCFQDDNFSNKESLHTLYLDLRSHLAHHMAIPHMDIGRKATLKIAARFMLRSIVQCHYETARALNMSFADFMEGPDFFAKNADMAKRRADLTAIRHDETWVDTVSLPEPSKRRFNSDKGWVRRLMKYTLNGHFVPLFKRFGDHVVIDAGLRGQLHAIWGAAQITYVDTDNRKHMTVRHSKRKMARELWTFLRLSWTFWRSYAPLKKSWQSGYSNFASEAFWQEKLAPSLTNGTHAEPEIEHA